MLQTDRKTKSEKRYSNTAIPQTVFEYLLNIRIFSCSLGRCILAHIASSQQEIIRRKRIAVYNDDRKMSMCYHISGRDSEWNSVERIPPLRSGTAP